MIRERERERERREGRKEAYRHGKAERIYKAWRNGGVWHVIHAYEERKREQERYTYNIYVHIKRKCYICEKQRITQHIRVAETDTSGTMQMNEIFAC